MAILQEWHSGALPTINKQNGLGEATAETSSPGFPKSWIELVQSGTNNLQAIIGWGFDSPNVSARFYYRAPEHYQDGGFSLASFQSLPGPTLMNDRIYSSGAGIPGQLRLSTQPNTTLYASNNKLIKPGAWHRIEFQYRRDAPGVVYTRARLFRIGSDIPVFDTNFIQSPNPTTSCAFFRIGIVQKTEGGQTPPIGLAHVTITDDLSTIGRHADDTLIPGYSRVSVWKNGVLVPATALYVWRDGQLVPIPELTAV